MVVGTEVGISLVTRGSGGTSDCCHEPSWLGARFLAFLCTEPHAGDATGGGEDGVDASTCCGFDVHKETVVACLRFVSAGQVTTEVPTFQTITADLLGLSSGWRKTSARMWRWKQEAGVAYLG